MIQRINETERITKELRAQGKVKVIIWTPEQQDNWNKQMDEIRRDYRHKAAMSEISASKTYFTC